MSCSKWAYSPMRCDGDYCPGDCDYCSKARTDCDEIWIRSHALTGDSLPVQIRWKNGDSNEVD